ncbi:MAG: response regulator, partial [Halobacteriovoraceae bacterium]|nr:response regulator [Halobacteriovoraceae bacterium]
MNKKKILVIDDEPEIREVIAAILESYFDRDILLAASGNEAIAILKAQHLEISLVLCDFSMPDGNGATVYNHLRETKSDIPYILCSSYEIGEIKEFENFKQTNPKNDSITKPFSSQILVDTISNALSDENQEVLEPYCRVRIDKFEEFCKDNLINVYIKLSSSKYIKILKENEKRAPGVFQKYIDKNAEYVWIENEKYQDVSDVILEKIFSALNTPNASPEEKIELTISGIEVIQDCVKNLGISQKTIEAIEKVVDSTEKAIKETDS